MDSNNNPSILGDLVVFAVIILAVLKLAGIISISWWLVFAPLLISIVASLIIILIVLAVALVIMGLRDVISLCEMAIKHCTR